MEALRHDWQNGLANDRESVAKLLQEAATNQFEQQYTLTNLLTNEVITGDGDFVAEERYRILLANPEMTADDLVIGTGSEDQQTHTIRMRDYYNGAYETRIRAEKAKAMQEARALAIQKATLKRRKSNTAARKARRNNR